MDQWLDSLSEDWISQPASPRSTSSRQTSVLRDASSPNSNSSQSRIPRYKHRSVSNLSIAGGTKDALGLSLRRANSNEVALREKTSSNLNASRNQMPHAQAKLQSPGTTSRKALGRHVSTGSMPIAPQDTVQIKASPAKKTDGQATPDWKRRVLKENMGKGDLFSPIALENVFRPPTIGPKQGVKPAIAKMKTPTKGDLPSSPPSYPALTHRPSTPNSDLRKLTSAPLSGSEHLGKDDSKYLLPQEIELPSIVGKKAGRVFSANMKSSGPTPSPDEDVGRVCALPAAPTPPQLGSHNRTGRRSGSRGANHSMISSVLGKTNDENISPFFVSRHNTVDGNVEYAAIDMSMRRLESQMDKLRMQQQNIPSSRSSDHEIDYANSRLSDLAPLVGQLDELTSQSLPDDLSMGTDAYAANGGFVSIHRGGYSNDGSFQRRPVSPSLLQDLDGPSMRSQKSITPNAISSPQLPKMFSQTKSSTPSSPPKTPKHQNHDSAGSHERPRSSGSPLKLFDKYDTFTNDRLARRMSKFEETMQQELQEKSSAESINARSSPSPGPKRRFQRSQNQKDKNVERGRRVCSFGNRDLDNHRFPTYEKPRSHSQDEETPELPQLENSDFRFERSRLDRSTGSNARTSRRSDAPETAGADALEKYHDDIPRSARSNLNRERHHQSELRQHDVLQATTGKRLPYSPAKESAPKRRRTIHKPDEMDKDIAQLRQQLGTREPSISMTGRKRKDALYETNTQIADPSILAMRQIRQPKLPASSPASSLAQNTAARTSDRLPQPPQCPAQNQDEASAIDPPTQIVAGALATVALNTVQDITYGSRKASVTTADFFNEAQQIMQLIRSQGRPRSSHATADEPGVGQPTIAEESIVEDSTKDEFSRPPSREGGRPPRPRNPAQTDARVISHLRRFEDQETLGLALSSSLKTLQFSQAGLTPETCAPEEENGGPRGGTESDPPNIRILDKVQSHKRNCSSSTRDSSVSVSERHVQSKDSQSSSGPSTGRSHPTGSSHSSAKRLVIAPQTVAHLLSDQMAGMVFDRQKQMWIKRKGSANVEHNEVHDHTVNDGTEEDLFGDIPDLSVDEMEELKRVKDSMSSIKSADSAANKVSGHDHAINNEADAKVVDVAEAVGDARPTTAEGKTIEAANDSSAPSKYSHFAWSGPQPGTRATSWGEEALPSKENQSGPSRNPSDQHEAEVEHEISILEGRESRVPKYQNSAHRQARVVTVAFSSPLVDQRELAYDDDDDDDDNDDDDDGEELDIWEGQSELNLEASLVHQNHQPLRSSSRRLSLGVVQKPGRRGTSRRLSFSNQSFHARPMSRLDEQDELSVVQYSSKGRPMTLEVEVSTPLPMSRSLMVPQTTGNRSSVSFHLSPLPDFTVHQIDKPLDGGLGQVVRRPKQSRASQADNRLSLAAQDLVKNLTDLEPYEPYWEYIRSVDLHDRELKTLHMLDEFCGGIEALDVSDNKLGEVNGIPSAVRQLNIRGNCLSDLTAWNTLYNIQYMNVSENNLQSVKGFHSLVHLRGLKADHNEIRNLNGLEDLDGLISLSLRGNMLKAVDFKSFNLQRLTDLDLCDNEIIQASNLDQLSRLKTCDLSYNELETLNICRADPLSNLEVLGVSNNCLFSLEVAAMPKLKILDIDKNSIAQIKNLNCLKQLETLSWREQRLNPASGLSEIQYNDCYELRNLYLSGNALSDFAPSTPFLNLHHLELASTGLSTFPPDFGLQCPNIRILNANYNAIHDLRPLLGIVKLERLFLAGNRVSRLRRTAAVIDRVGNGLLEVDMRNNPLTVGFYTPQEASREERRVVPHGRHSRASEDDAERDPHNTGAYLLPAMDKGADNLSRERLDEDTKLRRRVYEMLVTNNCKALKMLDGLKVDRGMVGRRDGVWERLIDLGVLKAKGRDDER